MLPRVLWIEHILEKYYKTLSHEKISVCFICNELIGCEYIFIYFSLIGLNSLI